ncbi:hypothetical protein ACSAGD_14415 [Paramicrobacterium sp. CJ85]|uniref:hypothetical protein n=1 Tax=Paramicrobacterium sp. CJ85 TaxID=3445355 RepID=UPI003F61D3EB
MSASSAARRSIRQFSIWVWVIGTIAAMGLAYAQTPALMMDLETGRIGTNPLRDRAWDEQNPVQFTSDGGTYSGEGSGYVTIPAEVDPSIIRFSELDGYADFYMTASSQVQRPAGDRERPRRIGSAYSQDDTVVMVPTGYDTELWVQAAGAWSFRLDAIDTTIITDTYSGSGNAYLLYEGEATSARFEHRGTGLFRVEVAGIGTGFDPIMQTDEANVVGTWDSSPNVVLVITADTGEGDWTVTMDAGGADSDDATTDDETETM